MRPSEGFEVWANAISLTWDVLLQRPRRISNSASSNWRRRNYGGGVYHLGAQVNVNLPGIPVKERQSHSLPKLL